MSKAFRLLVTALLGLGAAVVATVAVVTAAAPALATGEVRPHAAQGTDPTPNAPGTPSGTGSGAGATSSGFWDVGAPGVAVAAGLVLAAGLLNLPRPARDE